MSNLKINGHLSCGGGIFDSLTVDSKNPLPSYTTNGGVGVSISTGSISLINNFLVVEELQNGIKYDLNCKIQTTTAAYATVTITLPSSMDTSSANASTIQVTSGGDWKNWERVNAIGTSIEGLYVYLYICDDYSSTKYFYIHITVIK